MGNGQQRNRGNHNHIPRSGQLRTDRKEDRQFSLNEATKTTIQVLDEAMMTPKGIVLIAFWRKWGLSAIRDQVIRQWTHAADGHTNNRHMRKMAEKVIKKINWSQISERMEFWDKQYEEGFKEAPELRQGLQEFLESMAPLSQADAESGLKMLLSGKKEALTKEYLELRDKLESDSKQGPRETLPETPSSLREDLLKNF